jgi:hypothetical protein
MATRRKQGKREGLNARRAKAVKGEWWLASSGTTLFSSGVDDCRAQTGAVSRSSKGGTEGFVKERNMATKRARKSGKKVKNLRAKSLSGKKAKGVKGGTWSWRGTNQTRQTSLVVDI